MKLTFSYVHKYMSQVVSERGEMGRPIAGVCCSFIWGNREVLSDKVFEQRSEGSEGVTNVTMWGKGSRQREQHVQKP